MAECTLFPFQSEGSTEQEPASGLGGMPSPPTTARHRIWYRRDDDWRGSVEWLYHELLPTTGVCLLTAQSGAGKTFVALDLAESLALVRPFFGVEPENAGATALLVGEAFGSVKMRLQALQKAVPVYATYVSGLAARGALAALRHDLKELAAKIELLEGVRLRLVVLDTLSASGILDDENDNAKAATVMKAFSDLSTELNALFLVLHHPPKHGLGERGAGAIKNNADYALTIFREGQRPVREIEVTKSRDGECRVLGTFTLVPFVIGTDAKGREIKTMRVSAGEPRIRMAKRPSRHAVLLDECFGHVLAAEPFVIEGRPMAPREAVRKAFSARQPSGRDKSNVARDFRLALSTGGIEEITLGERAFLARRPVEGPAVVSRVTPKGGDTTDNPIGSPSMTTK